MKVWVLFQNDWPEGSGVIGIYSTPENAEKVKAERDNHDDYVEEYDLDAMMDWRTVQKFIVSIDARTGYEIDRWGERQWMLPESKPRVYGPTQTYRCPVEIRVVSYVGFDEAREVALRASEEWLRAQGGQS